MNRQLHVLIDTMTLPLESLPHDIHQMALGGASVIQLRSKSATTRELLAYGKVLKDLCRQYQLTFIVNDRLDVAMALEADGVHMGQDDMPVILAREMAPTMVIGLSVGSLENILEAENCPPDYFGLGPVYATSSKNDAGEALGTVRVAEWVRTAGAIAPVVAIGGINPANVAGVWRSGVQGIAVISAVVHSSDKKKACTQLLHPL